MKLYFDISEFIRTRATTGIQRVIREFLIRATKDELNLFVIFYDIKFQKFYTLSLKEVVSFLENIQNYELCLDRPIDLFEPFDEPRIFLDFESFWNIPLKRPYLYNRLKESNYKIINFIHDLVPVFFPDTINDNTRRNFAVSLSAIYQYTDLVLFNSFSAQDDFNSLKKKLNFERPIATRTVHLGSDFDATESEGKNPYLHILNKDYLLFVGTIEPRKKQSTVLKVFDQLQLKYQNLNLVFIGKIGWNSQDFYDQLSNHELIDQRIFHFTGINDTQLRAFYQNAFLVTYLSKYEGYGLPICESLSHGKITITSKNSSLFEVGRNYADYIQYESLIELREIISLYLEDKDLYERKQQEIQANFKTSSWNSFYESVVSILNNFQKAEDFRKKHSKKLQLVFISINYELLKETILECDAKLDFVKEYLVITRENLLVKFETLKSKHNIILIDESKLLGQLSNKFHLLDHTHKNWLLRAAILNIKNLEDEFIMLDDDNRPLQNVDINFYITDDGKYNAYYFYNLIEWNYQKSDYDQGQQHSLKALENHHLETYSYSCHKPQIINKKIFRESVELFLETGLKESIDEWNIYFNYAVSRYPTLFNKKIFQTLNWPARPSDWEYKFIPENFIFENYYEELYNETLFQKSDSLKNKIRLKECQYEPYRLQKELNIKIRTFLSKSNNIYGTLSLNTDLFKLYLINIPKIVYLVDESFTTIKLRFKWLNKKSSATSFILGYIRYDQTKDFSQSVQLPVQDFFDNIVLSKISSKFIEYEKEFLQLAVVVNGQVYTIPKGKIIIRKLSRVQAKDELELLKRRKIRYADRASFLFEKVANFFPFIHNI